MIKIDDKVVIKKDFFKEFIDFFENYSYLIHKLRGDTQVEPPISYYTEVGVEIRYKNIDIYLYPESFNLYIDKVKLDSFEKTTRLLNLPKDLTWKIHTMHNNILLHEISSEKIPYSYMNEIQKVLLNYI